MNMEQFLRKIPKAEIHCHIGTPPQLLVELAARNHIELPPYQEPEDLYQNITSLEEFLTLYSLYCQSIRSRDDFHQVVYNTLKSAAEDNVKYREMAWNPTVHLDVGVPFEVQVAGIFQGIKDAESEFGIICRMVAAINREDCLARALELVQVLIDNRSEYIVGVGLDYNEEGHPPERFEEPFQIAKRAGFGCTVHEGEVSTGPVEILNCLDVLKCDRIDHGYRILLDQEATALCAERGIHFGVIPAFQGGSSIPKANGDGFDPIPIKRMVEAGLKVSLNSDDPHFTGIGPADAYVMAYKEMDFTADQFLGFVQNSIDGSFLDDSLKRQWKREWTKEIQGMIGDLDI